MSTIENQVSNVIQQTPFEVKIGSKKFLFNRLSLSDRISISAFASELPVIENIEGENILYEAIEAGKYSKILAKIIAIASKPKSDWKIFRKWHIWYQKRRIYKALMEEPMAMSELYDIYKKIAMQISPAFFLDIIISLNGQNYLKPTKEI